MIGARTFLIFDSRCPFENSPRPEKFRPFMAGIGRAPLLVVEDGDVAA